MTVRKFTEMYEGHLYNIRILLTEINEGVEKVTTLNNMCDDKIPAEWMDAEIQGWSFDDDEKNYMLNCY